MAARSVPTSDVDLFDDAHLEDPYDAYRMLRDLGPVVRLERNHAVVVARYDDVKAVLANADGFCSGQGVGLNDFINAVGQGTTLMSDGEAHERQRKVIGQPMTPRALAALRPEAQRLADDLVDRLVPQATFDAVRDLAEVIPATWVPDLLGWPEAGREHLVRWGSDNFDALGPPNARTEAGGPGLLEMVSYAEHVANEASAPEGSMAAGVLEAARRGEIEPGQCPTLLIDYLAPSLDTTISAIGNAIWLFATNPAQWQLLRSNPTWIPNACNEILRIESPISCFTRVATRDVDVSGTVVAAGERVVVLYASANRDERRWDRPAEFSIRREAAGQLAFGFGTHACAGMGLARIEMAAVLAALVPRVATFDLVGATRKRNNLIRSFASLTVEVTAA